MYWKIVSQSPSKLLNPGNQIELHYNSRRYKHSSVEETNEDTYIPHISHVYVVYFEGTVAHDQTTESIVGIGPAYLDYTYKKYYHLQVSGVGPGTTFYKFDNTMGSITAAEQAHGDVEEEKMND